MIEPIRYTEDRLVMIDQTQLPETVAWLQLETVEEVWHAIREMRVRGAPAIAMVAAYGYAMAARSAQAKTPMELQARLATVKTYLESARPTAVNLFWAMERMAAVTLSLCDEAQKLAHADERQMVKWVVAGLFDEARAIQAEDETSCRAIGENLLTLMHDGMGVLTHCNTGTLATSKYGTALAGMYLAHERGWHIAVFADETRPVLQGARLTAWELQQAGIDVTLICDNMAATVMAQGKVQAVMVGADRIAANGDTANKIGTHGLAVLANHFGIPFYVAAPLSTFDLATPNGAAIVIEERDEREITEPFGKRIAPAEIQVYNPAFDVTPHELISAIVTERGVLPRPDLAVMSAFTGRWSS
ncbi:MAG: S-methyl-5-thioribose-1-phosphate isomerase [Firmicutes bacterium]|nr:S-methyl-5-thioribose-1-phosphate isomerase [Bacillota bacterium]